MAGEYVAQKKLGKAIRSIRTDLGYSQEEFAGACGLHRTYFGAVERGERNISLQNIVKIATALEITSSRLFQKARI